MWKKLIKKAEKRDNGARQKGAGIIQVNKFAERIKREYGIDLPADYKRFLLFSNGFGYNGFYIFGIAEAPKYLNMIENNKTLREEGDTDRYWFFGDSDMDWYALDTETGEYVVTGPEDDVYESFDTFVELLEYILESSLSFDEDDEDEDE